MRSDIEFVEEIKDAGKILCVAVCGRCKRREKSASDEGKTEFTRSLKMAGWKWKSGAWTCWRCLELT